jgi:L-threonylcarbamoyladenylate synthase
MNQALAQACALLRAGKTVAFPTETVYGLGADARNAQAVASVYAIKGRPSHNPLIVHLASAEALPLWAVNIPEQAYVLAQHFWPGPLTLVLHKHPQVLPEVCAGASTVAVRVPSHPVAQALLQAFGSGVAAPSANRSGHVSPTCAAHVQNDLGHAVGMVLDGGSSQVGLESTIVSLVGTAPAVLRPGSITTAMLEAVLQQRVDEPIESVVPAPGQSVSHYAPHAQVHLAHTLQEAHALLQNTPASHTGFLGIGFAPLGLCYTWNPTDAEAYAQGLYHALRMADEKGCKHVVALLPERQEIGMAVCDRLTRAAAPRNPI